VPPDDRCTTPDRGAVLVEASLALVVLVSLVVGIVDIGSLAQARVTLERTTSSAARVMATGTRASESDVEVLAAIGQALDAMPGAVLRRVVVFRADAMSGRPTAACTALMPGGASAHGVDGECNVYGPAQVDTAVMTGSMPAGCGPTSWEAAWCPALRSRQLATADHAGILVELEQRPPVAGMFTAAARTISATAVMRLEPGPS
jgi:Flp pilus assembly protein TadG